LGEVKLQEVGRILYEKGFLTRKELEFLEEYSNGKSLNQIAREFGVSPMTVWRRKERLKEKRRKAKETLKILRNYGYDEK